MRTIRCPPWYYSLEFRVTTKSKSQVDGQALGILLEGDWEVPETMEIESTHVDFFEVYMMLDGTIIEATPLKQESANKTQSPSFLAHQKAMEENKGKSNAQTLFQAGKIPTDNHFGHGKKHLAGRPVWQGGLDRLTGILYVTVQIGGSS